MLQISQRTRQSSRKFLSSILNEDMEVEFKMQGEVKVEKKKTTQSIEDIFEDLKNEFGEDTVKFQED